MASIPLGTTYEPVTVHPSIARVLGGFDRQQLSAFIAVGIELVDAMDGDPDANDTSDTEDDFGWTGHAIAYAPGGPGCPIADQGEDDDMDSAVDDYACDDENDDREQEHRLVPIYGIDQTKDHIGMQGYNRPSARSAGQ